ncbi:protoporphyrinogen oxidase [Intrasporangium mesophilum]
MADNPGHRHVVVVGGGMSGLVAARRLRQSGSEVTLVEADNRLGGQVHTAQVGGRLVDVGAEALHLGSPTVQALVDELGLTSTVVGSRPGQSWLWTRDRLRPLPPGMTPTGPTRLRPVVTSGVMSVRGIGRAGLEPVAARLRPALGADEDVSVGEFVTGRFGSEVTERFVDPLLGSLHAGDVHRLSLRACAPGLVEAATQRRSVVARRRAPRARSGGNPLQKAPTLPMFGSWPGGLETLTRALLDGQSVEVRLDTRVVSIARRARGYTVTTESAGRTSTLDVDGVVLAIPAHAAAPLLLPHAAAAARLLAEAVVARVATVVVGFDRAQTQGLRALGGTGLLLPSTAGGSLKAVTHLSRKWPQFADDDLTLLRLSAGRATYDPPNGLDGPDGPLDGLDDEALVAGLLRDLAQVSGLEAAPRLVHVERWSAGLPQLRVGHHARLRAIRHEVAERLPGVALAGSAYDGLGLVSCISSGEAAARALAA